VIVDSASGLVGGGSMITANDGQPFRSRISTGLLPIFPCDLFLAAPVVSGLSTNPAHAPSSGKNDVLTIGEA